MCVDVLVVLTPSRSYALKVLLHPFHPTDWSHDPEHFRYELEVHSSGSVRVPSLSNSAESVGCFPQPGLPRHPAMIPLIFPAENNELSVGR